MTKPEKVEKCKSILNRHKAKLDNPKVSSPRSELSSDERDFVLEILNRHPNAKRKIGVGVESIFVQEAHGKKSFGKKSFCFHVKRIDGTEEDFSYRLSLGLPKSGGYKWKR